MSIKYLSVFDIHTVDPNKMHFILCSKDIEKKTDDVLLFLHTMAYNTYISMEKEGIIQICKQQLHEAKIHIKCKFSLIFSNASFVHIYVSYFTATA